jgi:hypothetical protein
MLPEQTGPVSNAPPPAEPASPAAQLVAAPTADPVGPLTQPGLLPVAERANPTSHGAHAPTTCANCGAAVSGNFCGQCGQRREHEIHSVWHFTQEATEDLTHADSRLWSTMIALLFEPGFLTREFLAGRRVRYLPPLRLYLVLSVVFFLILGMGNHDPKAVSLQTKNGKPSVALVNPNEVNEIAIRPGETPEQRADRVCKPEYDGPGRGFLVPLITKGCRKSMLDNGRTISEALMHNLPRAMFIFLPALAAVMKLMYWRPRRYYVEHLLFFLHAHAFAFAVLSVYILLLRAVPAALEDWLTLIVWLYFPYYLFVSIRRVYGQGRFMTFLKFSALSLTYLIGAALTLVLTVTYSVYML